jgi:hypothetical protein
VSHLPPPIHDDRLRAVVVPSGLWV